VRHHRRGADADTCSANPNAFTDTNATPNSHSAADADTPSADTTSGFGIRRCHSERIARRHKSRLIPYRVLVQDKRSNGEGAPIASPDGMVEVISMKGEVVGKNSRIAIGGLFAAFLSGDPQKSTEFITVDGKSYIRGPAPLFGAPDDACVRTSARSAITRRNG
jgi:hypothetical protein